MRWPNPPLGGSAEENEIKLAEIVWQRLKDTYTEWELERRRAHLALARVRMEGPDEVTTAAERLLDDLHRQRRERSRLPAFLRDPGEQDTRPDVVNNSVATHRSHRLLLEACRRALKTRRRFPARRTG